jgi:hypothetical protein
MPVCKSVRKAPPIAIADPVVDDDEEELHTPPPGDEQQLHGSTRRRIVAEAAFVKSHLWPQHAVITISFVGGSAVERVIVKERVRGHIEPYVNLTLQFLTPAEGHGQIRIAFNKSADAGSWSHMGTEALDIPSDEPTMNLGWDISGDPAVCLHEFLHALGATHEISNSIGSEQPCLDWDTITRDYGDQPNNWSPDTIRAQFALAEADDLVGGGYDPLSIMHYPLPAEHLLTEADIRADPSLVADQPDCKVGVPVGWNKQMSAQDVKWLALTYPLNAKATSECECAAGMRETPYRYMSHTEYDRRIKSRNVAEFAMCILILVLFVAIAILIMWRRRCEQKEL